jgi:hypothetical protein
MFRERLKIERLPVGLHVLMKGLRDTLLVDDQLRAITIRGQCDKRLVYCLGSAVAIISSLMA